jgi:hypothetical protein
LKTTGEIIRNHPKLIPRKLTRTTKKTTKKGKEEVKEFEITSFCISGTKDIIIARKKEDFLNVIGDGGVMVDENGGGWAMSDVATYHCPRYR